MITCKCGVRVDGVRIGDDPDTTDPLGQDSKVPVLQLPVHYNPVHKKLSKRHGALVACPRLYRHDEAMRLGTAIIPLSSKIAESLNKWLGHCLVEIGTRRA